MTREKIKQALRNSSHMLKPEMKAVQFDGYDMINFAEGIAVQSAAEELERLIGYYEIAVERRIKDRIYELKEKQDD